MFTRDKCSSNIAPSILSASLPMDYVGYADQSGQHVFLGDVSCDTDRL